MVTKIFPHFADHRYEQKPLFFAALSTHRPCVERAHFPTLHSLFNSHFSHTHIIHFQIANYYIEMKEIYKKKKSITNNKPTDQPTVLNTKSKDLRI